MSNPRNPDIFERASLFEAEAHALLETHEGAYRSRVIKLSELVEQLTALNLLQESLFRQAIRCAENGIYLAAHVMAWAALMDLYEEKLASDGLTAVRREYPKWPTKSLEDLRENVNEFQLIDAGKRVGLLAKGNHKSMQGHLHTRNQAAHPTGFEPGINETLGYIEALIKLAKIIETKTL
jgi:hypothetical protein